MFEFKKKETLIQNIAFMSLMGAINLIIALLMTFIPYIIAFSLIFLPVTSVLVTLYCKKQLFPLYFFLTIGLCLLVTMYNITDTLFFIIPSMISGFLFGLLVELKAPSLYLIILPSFVTLGFTYLSVPFINLIYGFNFIDTILISIKLNDVDNINTIIPSAVFLFCLIQSLFSYIVIKEELSKFKITILEGKYYNLINLLINVLCLLIVFAFSFFYLIISYMFLVVSIFITMYLLIDLLITKKKLYVICSGFSFIITFFVFSICYQYVPSDKALLLTTVFNILITIIYSVNIYLHSLNNKSKIEKGNS